MKISGMALGVLLASSGAAFGFDSDSQAVVDRYKAGKVLPMTDVRSLMLGSEKWCYLPEASSCAWTDIYLSADADNAVFEIANAWDEVHDIAYVSRARFEGDLLCEEDDDDWVPRLRATLREDGSAVYGRDLEALKDRVYTIVADSTDDCFDYVYGSADAGAQTITLTQRQYVDGAYDRSLDAVVKLYFDAEAAAALDWRW